MLTFFSSDNAVVGELETLSERLGDGCCTLEPELELERGRARDPRRDPPRLSEFDREP